MIYTVGGIKGGVGKTTVATNLVVWLAKQGSDVLLVDTDFQHTATHFTTWREAALNGDTGFTSLRLTGEAVRREIVKLKEKFKHIVIDAGGSNTVSQRAAIIMSDVYLLPFQPTSADIATGELVDELLQEARAVKPDEIRAYSFLSRANPRGQDNVQAGEILSQLQGITYLPDVLLVNRKAYSDAFGKGLAVFEMKAGAQVDKATAEINTLFSIITQQPKNVNRKNLKESASHS